MADELTSNSDEQYNSIDIGAAVIDINYRRLLQGN